MALPECTDSTAHPSSNRADLTAALAVTDKQLELADTIENPIERCLRRDQLLEVHDWLRAEIDLSPPKRR
jgi:hypothetical protein